MKIPVLLLTLGMLTSSLVPGNAAALLQYKFDKAGAVQASSGIHSLALTQLNYSNVATDYITTTPKEGGGTSTKLALNFTGANVDTGLGAADKNKGAVQASINSTTNAYLRDELGSFTISAWVLDVTGSADRRIFTLRDTGLNQSVIDFRLSANNTLMLTITGVNGADTLFNTEVTAPLNSDKWNFIAVSYDAVTGNTTFYSGLEGGTIESGMDVNTTTGALSKSATVLSIGNVGYEHQRRLDGYLSDVQFFNTALTAEEIGAIYAIPEPSVSMLLGGSIFLAGAFSIKYLKR